MLFDDSDATTAEWNPSGDRRYLGIKGHALTLGPRQILAQVLAPVPLQLIEDLRAEVQDGGV